MCGSINIYLQFEVIHVSKLVIYIFPYISDVKKEILNVEVTVLHIRFYSILYNTCRDCKLTEKFLEISKHVSYQNC